MIVYARNHFYVLHSYIIISTNFCCINCIQWRVGDHKSGGHGDCGECQRSCRLSFVTITPIDDAAVLAA
jgi:hypothetical protein